jgi:hypothetical protein
MVDLVYISPALKRASKLRRDHYFFIRIGGLFFAGEVVEKRSIEILDPVCFDETDVWRLRKAPARVRRCHYNQPRRLTSSKIQITELTGKTSPILNGDQDSAKKFRKYKQAKSACERLNSYYNGCSAHARVEFHGDENDYT